MIFRRICYLLLLAVGGCFVMLYDFPGLRFLLCCVVFLPMACLLLLIPGALLCRIELKAGRAAVTRGDSVRFHVTVENRGPFPVSRVLIVMCWNVPGERTVRAKKWLCGLGRGCKEEISLELDALHCGRARLLVKKAVVFDYLGIFGLPVRGKRESEICVLPVITPISHETLDVSVWNIREMGGEKEGDLLLRDFRPGDSLHRVYWKLTAKDGELKIRDFEQRASLTIFLKFPDPLRERAEEWDRYLDRACSLLYFFAGFSGQTKQTVQTTLAVVWRQGYNFLKYEISGEDNLQAWVNVLLMQESVGVSLTDEDESFLENGFHLEEDGRLYFGEQCVYGE